MIARIDRLQRILDEYQTLVGPLAHKPHAEMGETEWGRLREVLSDEAEWTPDAAEALLSLARQYGSFMLRNALALAVVLGIEDGELGF